MVMGCIDIYIYIIHIQLNRAFSAAKMPRGAGDAHPEPRKDAGASLRP